MKRSIATCVALLCGLWLGGAAGPRAAFADEAWGLVRITCVPEARYFSIGRIGRDQAEDYAARKGLDIGEAERWLAPNLAYTPSVPAAG